MEFAIRILESYRVFSGTETIRIDEGITVSVDLLRFAERFADHDVRIETARSSFESNGGGHSFRNVVRSNVDIRERRSNIGRFARFGHNVFSRSGRYLNFRPQVPFQ